jgi:hypothetical protein
VFAAFAEDGINVSYMWENIRTKEKIILLIGGGLGACHGA